MSFKADLHCHSNFSDGSLSPEELLHLAKSTSLSAISITDHDTIDGYTSSLFQLADFLSIKLLSGVEISSLYNNLSIHILGYGFDLKNEPFRAFLKEARDKRQKRNEAILLKLKAKGFKLDNFKIIEGHSIGRAHIARALIDKEFVSSFEEAFFYLKERGSCYVRGDKFSSLEVIEQIKKAHGKAILAHPHLIKGNVKSLLKLPFDGIEAFYGKIRDKRWEEMAKTRGLLITGGSDFHGIDKPNSSLGSSWIDEENFKLLF